MAALPLPISLPTLEAPDRDFDSIRAVAINVVTEDAGLTWTDHNFSDPGITFLEVLAWGFADLHYRTATRGFERAPLEIPLWLDPQDREWFGMSDLGNPQSIVSLAALLATRVPADTGPTEAERMAGIIKKLNSRREAIGALADRKFGKPAQSLTWSEASAVVALVRAPVLRRAALDASELLSSAWAEARRTVERRAAGGPIDEGKVDDETVRLLGFAATLADVWEDEIRTLIRRYRHRLFLDRAATFAPVADAQAQPTITGIRDALDLDEDDARAVMALHPCPAAATPEMWETANGSTRTWPPHPLQVLAIEPVTAEDYSTRAREAPRVRRAWTVPGALAGIAWDGSDRAQADPSRKGTLTLLVEFKQVPPNPAKRRQWMREVLGFVTAGKGEDAESDLPYDTLTAANLQVPRRVMCDELTVAMVERCPVILYGVIHVALGADRAEVLKAALARVEAWFAAGRRESASAPEAAVECPTGIDGPWPMVRQPEGGWMPGEAIRLNELVQVLAADPTVIGVEGVGATVNGTSYQIDEDKTEALLDLGCVPVLSDTQCVQVQLELGADCRG